MEDGNIGVWVPLLEVKRIANTIVGDSFYATRIIVL